MNSAAPWPGPQAAQERVLGIQRKLHKWAEDDQDRRFTDLHNLVCDPATLMVAWQRVRANRGSRSAGVDRQNAYDIERRLGVEQFLGGLREELRAGSFRSAPVKERVIPKRGGKLRRLGIATVRDRVVQAALKLVLEPIFEADFQPCSYGFRPGRRAQDAIAEVHHFTSRSYEWVVEGDIEACFDRIDHQTLMRRVRGRIGDKRVLALIKVFLWAGILTEHGDLEDTVTGTPQGGILSPLLANIALSALDEHWLAACLPPVKAKWDADVAAVLAGGPHARAATGLSVMAMAASGDVMRAEKRAAGLPSEPWAAELRLRVAGVRGSHRLLERTAEEFLDFHPDATGRLLAGTALAGAGKLKRAGDVLGGVAHDLNAPPMVRADAFAALVRTLADRDAWDQASREWKSWQEMSSSQLDRPDDRVSAWQVRIVHHEARRTRPRSPGVA